MLALLIFIFIILIIPFCSFMISRKVYKSMVAKENSWAFLVSAITFLLFFAAISAVTLAIVFHNVEFSR